MDEKRLEQLINETLYAAGGRLTAPDKLKTRIDFTMKTNTSPRRKMKAWKRMGIAVAAVFAVAVTGALASGQIAAWSSSTNWNGGWKNFDQTAEKAEAVSPDMKYTETLLGEFQFVRGTQDEVRKIDDSGKTVDTFPELYMTYRNDKGITLSYTASPVQPEGGYESPFDETREIGGVTVGYRMIPQIFLPADGSELPTAEEQAKMDAGEINIAYGSETREEDNFYRVHWIQDGIAYSILCMEDSGLSADDFFQMAQELIEAA